MQNFESEEKDLSDMTTTSVQRSRRWAFTIVNAEAQDKYQLGNATLYLGPTERDSLQVSHLHGIAFGNVREWQGSFYKEAFIA